MPKQRLDVVLVERGLAESRAQAQALVLAGLVPGHSKPGEQVAADIELEVVEPPPYVSRAGHKLVHALDAFAVDVQGRTLEAVSSPVSETIEGNDILRHLLAVEADVEKQMQGGSAEITP